MKKLYYLSGVVASLALLAGCNGQSTQSSGPSLEEVGFTPGQLPLVETQVEYKIVSPKNAMAKSYNDMELFQQMEADTNVKINWENMSEESFSTRKNLILSDKKNLPDAMYHAGFSDKDIIQYSSSGLVIPIDEYLDYMPNFKGILEKREDIKNMITAPDGHIYALPRIEEMGLVEYPNLFFINKNWLDQLGLEVPKTINELEYVLTQFKENDMNGNGDTTDEIPLSFKFQGWQGNQADLYSAFGMPMNTDHKIVIDDEVVFTAMTDEFKEATAFYHEWIKNGLIDKEIFTQDEFTFLSKGKGKDQILGAFYWWELETVVSNPEDYVIVPPLVGPNGDQMIGVANNYEVSKGLFVVFNNCKNPEILLSWIDRFYEPEISAQVNYGPIGIVYEEERNAEGLMVQKTLPEGKTSDEVRLTNAPMGVIYLSDDEWANVVEMEPRAQLRLSNLETYAKPYVPEGVEQYPNVTYTLEEINEMNRYVSDIYDYVWQKQTNWLLNGGVEQEWEAYISKLKDMGVDKLVQTYQDAYDRYIGK